MIPFTFDPKRYPPTPGCYLMRDAAGRVLYVGKAKDLRRRLGSYFRPKGRGWKTRRLIARVRAIEVILVRNEVESLLLENNLIKHHKPPFNVQLVADDSGYFHIALTGEDLPRLAPYRPLRINKELGQDEIARTFGPYVSRGFRDTLLDYVCETFGVRTCTRLPRQVCLRYHLGRCCGVCEGHVSRPEYAQIIDRVICFLSGDSHAHTYGNLIVHMRAQMQEAAGQEQFERATRIRDQVRALESTLEQQVVDRGVVGAGRDHAVVYLGRTHALIADVRRGKVLGLSLHKLEAGGGAALLWFRYARQAPPRLVVNRLERRSEVEQELTAANGYPVEIVVPEQGVLCELLEFCELNYVYRTTDGRRQTTDD